MHVHQVRAAGVRGVARLLGIVFGLVTSLLVLATSAEAATITVTTVADTTTVDGEASLREAITSVNAGADLNADVTARRVGAYGPTDTIVFAIGAVGSQQTIIVTGVTLPAINSTRPLLLDAWSQGGGGYTGPPLIEISGDAVANIDGLTISSDSVSVRGFVLGGFGGVAQAGIRVVSSGSNATILGNYLGTNAAGTAAHRNSIGIVVDAADNVTIGGTTASARNVISGNTAPGFVGVGVFFSGAGSTNGKVLGNYIGTDPTGTMAMPNDVGVQIQDAPGVTVGGTTPGARNVISGNTNAAPSGTGIFVVLAGSTGTVIQGNYIGTNAAGTAALGNNFGIFLFSAPNTTVGGTTASARNIISGNTSAAGSGAGVMVFFAGATNTTVQGNYIGTDVNGTAAIRNDTGVQVQDAPGATIGGTASGARNLISGNTTGASDGAGVRLQNSVLAASTGTVQGNSIGTNASGTGTLPNNLGVLLANVSGVTVGGPAAGAANTIAFNTGIGVRGQTGVGNSVRANLIHSNGGLGIDLDPAGVTPNDEGDGDAGPNMLQNFPVLTGATVGSGSTQILGRLNSTANTTFNVDLYGSPSCDGSGNGEGQTFLGSTTATTDGGGNASFAAVGLPVTTAGSVVTATATNPANNTSEFSACATVAPSGIVVTPTILALTEGGATGTFTVALATVPANTVTVTLTFDAGQLGLTLATLTFPPDARALTPQTVTVTAINDAIAQGTRTATIAFGVASGDAQYNGFAVAGLPVTITDDESAAGLNVANVTVAEPASPSATGTAALAVTLSPPSAQTVTVGYATANGTATGGAACGGAGVDFVAANGIVTFAPGEVSKPVAVTICGDGTSEPGEAFTVGLSSPTGGALLGAHPTATVSIADASGLGLVSIGDATATETDTGTTTLTFPVTLAPPSTSPVSISFATGNGTATGGPSCAAGVDYLTTSGTLTFQPLETSKSVVVTVCADTLTEGNESLTLTLTNPTGAAIGDGQGAGTIADNDQAGTVELSAAAVQAPESAGSVTLTVQRSGVGQASTGSGLIPSGGRLTPNAISAITVAFATANGTATAGQDYTATSGTLNFGVGETPQTIIVPILTDSESESPETFTVTLSSPTGGAAIGAQATITVTIIDTTTRPPQIKQGDDDTDKPRKETEEQRQQRERTNRSNRDDVYTEGNVVEVHQGPDEPQPYAVIANSDGLQRVNLLCGSQCPKIRVGDYLEADGEKQHEGLFDATDVTVRRNGR